MSCKFQNRLPGVSSIDFNRIWKIQVFGQNWQKWQGVPLAIFFSGRQKKVGLKFAGKLANLVQRVTLEYWRSKVKNKFFTFFYCINIFHIFVKILPYGPKIRQFMS